MTHQAKWLSPPSLLDQQKVPIGFLNDLLHADTDDGVGAVYTRWARRVTGADRCAIARPDGTGMLKVSTASGARIADAAASYSIRGSFLGDAMLQRKSKIVESLNRQPYDGCRVLAAIGMRCIIIAPIIADDVTFGVISASYANHKRPHQSALAVLDAMAGCLATHLLLNKKMDQLTHLAQTDPLTGAANRVSFDHKSDVIWQDWQTLGRPFTVISLDLDHFKRVNDTMGHAVGDIVLCETVKRLNACTRSGDLVVRMGGEEFCVLMSGVNCVAAEVLIKRLHSSINQSPVHTTDGMVPVTASIGAASVQSEDTDVLDVLKRSDAALYQAKDAGRDRVVLDA